MVLRGVLIGVLSQTEPLLYRRMCEPLGQGRSKNTSMARRLKEEKILSTKRHVQTCHRNPSKFTNISKRIFSSNRQASATFEKTFEKCVNSSGFQCIEFKRKVFRTEVA